MKKILGSLIIILIAAFLYGKYVEVNNFQIKEYTIKNENIPNSFKDLKVVHFSDLLYEDTYQDKLNDLVDKINKIEADIIIFSGDLFKAKAKYNIDDYEFLTKAFKKMNASLYKYAVIGDNDESNVGKYKDIMYEADFKLLDNENILLFYKDITPINIIGLTNLDNVNDLLVSETPYNYSIAIIHQPDNFEELSKLNINTILSGHSLGGIINIPYYGGLIKKDGAKTYISSYYKLNNSEIYISNGLGYEDINYRLFNTPSINVYRFSN